MQDLVERAHEFGARMLQFAHVELGEGSQKPFAFRCDAEQNTAVVDWVGKPAQQSLLDCAIDELNRAVVLEEHAGSYVGDRRRDSVWHAADTLQHLILLASQACLFDHGATEVEKAAQLKAKLGQALQLGKVKLWNRGSDGFARRRAEGPGIDTGRQC